MKKRIHHYYPGLPTGGWKTACGRDGRKTGGFIAYFFKEVRLKNRCKTCQKQFERDQKISRKKA